VNRNLLYHICLALLLLYPINVHTRSLHVDEHMASPYEPAVAGSQAVVLFLAAVCPPVAVVAEIAALGAAGFVFYYVHRRSQKNNPPCFSLEPVQDCIPTKHVPCFTPAEVAKQYSGPCVIRVDNQYKPAEPTPYLKSDEVSVGCEFPIEVVTVSTLAFQDTQKDVSPKNSETENKRYEGPYYARTEDWIKDHPFGQKIKNSLERSIYTNQGKRAFEVVKKIENCDGFKKGDYVVVDALHKDHLEVFGKGREWKSVANFDGTMNVEKTEQGRKESRRPLE